MNLLKNVILIFAASFMLSSCGNKTNTQKPLTVKEFLSFYKPVTLPYSLSGSDISTAGDTTTISLADFARFIPDSAIKQSPSTNKKNNLIIHPVGIIHFKAEDYLLSKLSTGKNDALFVFVLDEKHQYKTSLPLLNTKLSDGYNYSVNITNEPTFIIKKEKTSAGNEVFYSRNGYAYNAAANLFAEVMNDSNEDTAKTSEVVNPIDTLPQKNKLSGDYITDKKNFISVRDGKNAKRYLFFIHFEKNNGACKGELKGELNLVNETAGIYQETGDLCVIDFKFSPNKISVKEEGNCGNYRGITCPFDVSFKKKKSLKTRIK